MKERPIIFNGEMVRAILYGRKTQTRRPLKPQPIISGSGEIWWPGGVCDPRSLGYANERHFQKGAPLDQKCMGNVGDKLWVRETWYCDHMYAMDYERTSKGLYVNKTLTRQECESEWTEDGMMYYRADGELGDQIEQCEKPNSWRPSIHMPRWASRITLRIKNIRVERLQSISEHDAKAEGVLGKKYHGYEHMVQPSPNPLSGHGMGPLNPLTGRGKWLPYTLSFASTWDGIYYDKVLGWIRNPWVWVIDFERTS